MAKALMVVGTNSSAGKSFLVAGLGRILRKKGVRVAPFKAQNMSLQSFVCKDGGEIGIAQALQALACGVEPESTFNPILLKPEGEGKSQVLLCGKLYKTLSAREYYQEKERLWKYVKEVLDELSERFEILLLEGAGSPAEINLLKADLVNIKPALYLKAPVLVVGDIDKGGVFASLYGTLVLLKKFSPPYASLIKGFIINKFRGDKTILEPGLKDLYELTKIPSLGILPYLEDLKLTEEDGFSFFTKKLPWKNFSTEGSIRIVVLALKHLSNFSDFDPFYLEDDVELIYSLRREDLLSADIIIIPGSKNTFSDLQRLKALGVKNILIRALEQGTEIIGICGGYQMLGKVLRNPYKVEGEVEEIEGLGFLDIETTFYPEKITTQVRAYPLHPILEPPFEDINLPLWGYEIHKGITEGDLNLFRLERTSTGEVLVDGKREGHIWGTYLHGLFTNDHFRCALLNRHRQRKGLPLQLNPPSYFQILEHTFDLIADTLEKHLDLSKIYQMLKL